MTWFWVKAAGHHGYPQPEDSYLEQTYSAVCHHCGIHAEQSTPFRFKAEPKASHSQFLQLNWVFDAFFVRPEVAVDCASVSLTGLNFTHVLRHSTGLALSTIAQMQIPTVVRCALVDHLPPVTCRPYNEEGVPPHPAFVKGAYCSRVKHHPPTTLGVASKALHGLPDIFQTEEWFGSGGSAWRATLVSERFAQLIRSRRWRGVSLEEIALDAPCERAI
jgi:hypothetical protein